MSQEALRWVIESAPPFPPHLFAVLTVLAWHADSNGRGSYPSVPTIAARVRKTHRTVRRDLRELKELTLIRPGDPTLASHIPADRRPEVYDLAIEQTAPRERDGADLTPASPRTPTSGNGTKKNRNSPHQPPTRNTHHDAPASPDTDTTPTPTSTPPESPQVTTPHTAGHGRPPGHAHPPNQGGDDPHPARHTARTNPVDIVMAHTDATATEARAVVDLIRRTYNPTTMRGYLTTMAANDTLTDALETIRWETNQPRPADLTRIPVRDRWLYRD
ncbi:helix-turn-helix domain-containing protein [Thermobifida halotolerans]|uniref:Helix-turn-helix domain-containing protein n=1 Tax=Thermobifida halotolerans TaxID=483545 RepID=A0AA97M5Z1_9ACTN|nr:helix-turn-helix domain-containing protein [Thermobifida halotolerans]UOE21497.1 helix-turn-helix domain-containing protein [Thermobifida halotolerans]